MTVSEAVSRFIHDGDYIASGGFGGVRIATAVTRVAALCDDPFESLRPN